MFFCKSLEFGSAYRTKCGIADRHHRFSEFALARIFCLLVSFARGAGV
jgi:hypothetical protein